MMSYFIFAARALFFDARCITLIFLKIKISSVEILSTLHFKRLFQRGETSLSASRIGYFHQYKTFKEKSIRFTFVLDKGFLVPVKFPKTMPKRVLTVCKFLECSKKFLFFYFFCMKRSKELRPIHAERYLDYKNVFLRIFFRTKRW